MCERRVRIRALAIVVAMFLAMTGSSAWAAVCSTSRTLTNQTCSSWRTTTSGVKYCTVWCTGSMICDNSIAGLGGNVVKECEPGEDGNCPITSCTAWGTKPVEGSVGTCDSTNLDNLNETCGIEGKLVCELGIDSTGGDDSDEVIILPGFVNTTSRTLICDKKGKCTNTLRLRPKGAAALCPEGTEFETFTAAEFKAQSCFCPGGDDTNDTCCATSARNSNGTCSVPYGTGSSIGTPTCVISLCQVDLTNYDPDDNFRLPYDCSNADACGGVTGDPCPEPSGSE